MGTLDGLKTLGYFFYVVSPNRTSFQTIDEVPDYTTMVVPYFIAFMLMEQCFMRLTNKKAQIRVNDIIGSISQGILSEIPGMLLRGWKIAVYVYIYSNWRIVELPWNSLWTWWICLVGIDFFYYWAHRASHEINFLWAAHQVHHSSEDYNLSTALRQSVFQSYFLLVFYLPLALAIPPSVYLVHSYFNLLYQFWIHTEVIKSLGPLEYILNTASHHRVHHGRNRYCIDKNYAGTLIIWDRMFGTFEAESAEVVYGLTHPIDSFEPFYIQLCHFKHIWKTFVATEGWRNKLSVLLKGPGWAPGKQRLGSIEDIPHVKAPIQKFNPQLSLWCVWYLVCHFCLLIFVYVEIAEGQGNICSPAILYGAIVYEIFSLAAIGFLIEGRSNVCWVELLRCILYIGLDYYFLPFTRISILSSYYKSICLTTIRLTFFLSGIIWLRQCVKSVSITLYSDIKKSRMTAAGIVKYNEIQEFKKSIVLKYFIYCI